VGGGGEDRAPDRVEVVVGGVVIARIGCAVVHLHAVSAATIVTLVGDLIEPNVVGIGTGPAVIVRDQGTLGGCSDP